MDLTGVWGYEVRDVYNGYKKGLLVISLTDANY
jgi:hypothetical protein